MYATFTGNHASMFGSRNLSNVYRQIDLETGVAGSSAHHLITLLFNGALESMTLANTAMTAKDIPVKCQAITRAIRIVDEGLKASLDLNAGGEIAQNLHDLYTYICLRLSLANSRNDESMIRESIQLLSPIRDAWVSIAPANAEVVRATMEMQA